ncbi:unnamed protein product [Closterium sp. Naga37s-1]|nr:unnamed protein product [Closterium sp. Naga37s-1]
MSTTGAAFSLLPAQRCQHATFLLPTHSSAHPPPHDRICTRGSRFSQSQFALHSPHSLPEPQLPSNLGAFPALKHLELHLLPLTDLPDSLCQLTSLKFFSLLYCQRIHQLPDEFSCLTALETLYLGQSQVLMYPDDIGRLSNLKTLLLEGNCEAQRLLPSSLTQLSALTRLELKHFQFTELPEDIGMLSNLQHLHMCSCFHLTALPDSFSRLTALEILRIDGCEQLSSIPRLDALTRLKRLELIDDLNRRLAEPPASLPPSLEILTMPSYNQHAPCFDMPRMPHLRNLKLRNVGAGSSLAVAMGASRLRRLQLVPAGHAEDLPSPFPVLPHLHTLLLLGSPNFFPYDYADLTRLPECIGSSVPRLRRLKVEQLSLTELPASVCELQCLTSLEVIRCRLVCLPGGIGALTRLCKLDVSRCRALQQLPASLTHLTCLQELDASYTGILSLPSGFARLARLRRLSVNGCEHLEALPHDVMELRMLRYLGARDCTHLLDSEDMVQPRGVYSMYGLELDDERTMYRRVA